MQKTKKLPPTSIRLEPDLKKELERRAKADERSLSQYITMILRRHVAEPKRSSP